jgi:serine/threonine protein kinase
MIPRITNWDDLAFASEEVDPDSNEFQYTSFGLIDDNDTLHYGQLGAPKAEISLEHLMAALNTVPDDAIFPPWPLSEAKLRKAPETLPANVYIKRPTLELYGMLKKLGIEKQLFNALVAEAQVLEELSQRPHPNLIRYHGCRVARGHITGLVLDRHPHDLQTHVQHGYETIDKALFMAALESAIQHLHGLGWAHNDLNPANVLVSEAGMPVLIDFGGCQKLGTKLKYIRGTKEWIEGEVGDYTTSEAQHDTFALGRFGLGSRIQARRSECGLLGALICHLKLLQVSYTPQYSPTIAQLHHQEDPT